MAPWHSPNLPVPVSHLHPAPGLFQRHRGSACHSGLVHLLPGPQLTSKTYSLCSLRILISLISFQPCLVHLQSCCGLGPAFLPYFSLYHCRQINYIYVKENAHSTELTLLRMIFAIRNLDVHALGT